MRQLHAKDRPCRFPPPMDVPAVILSCLTSYCQTKANAFGLSTEEGVKPPSCNAGRRTGTGIRDFNKRSRLRAHRDFHASARTGSLNGVRDQIHEQVAKRFRIAFEFDRSAAAVEVNFDLRVFA